MVITKWEQAADFDEKTRALNPGLREVNRPYPAVPKMSDNAPFSWKIKYITPLPLLSDTMDVQYEGLSGHDPYQTTYQHVYFFI